MRKKCNLGWFREFLFTISSLEWILHSLYQGCVFSKIWRELGFVHYIEYFTISRFTISRLGCTRFLYVCSIHISNPFYIIHIPVFNLFSNTEAKKHSTIPQTQKQNKKKLHRNSLNLCIFPLWCWLAEIIKERGQAHIIIVCSIISKNGTNFCL